MSPLRPSRKGVTIHWRHQDEKLSVAPKNTSTKEHSNQDLRCTSKNIISPAFIARFGPDCCVLQKCCKTSAASTEGAKVCVATAYNSYPRQSPRRPEACYNIRQKYHLPGISPLRLKALNLTLQRNPSKTFFQAPTQSHGGLEYVE